MTQEQHYTSLTEIEARKQELRSQIQAEGSNIQQLTSNLFRRGNDIGHSPSKRIASIISTGSGLFDGLLLGWKLYRRFGPRRRK